MIINKAILHILDFHSGMCILSQGELDFSDKDNSICMYIEKHIKHIQCDTNQKPGSFLSGSSFFTWLKHYLTQQVNFIEFSTFVGNTLYEHISHSDQLDAADLLVVDFSDNDIRYIALLLLKSRIAYTHQAINSEGSIHNEIIRHYAILPNTTQKIDVYALVRCDNFMIGFNDKRRMVDGQDTYLLPDSLLQCTASVSGKEAIKAVNHLVTGVAEKYGANSTIAISKAKNYLLENAEISSTFSPVELGQDIFADSEEMQKEFELQTSKAQLPKEIKIEKNFAIRTGKSHKIKTDTGIEITFPAEYFNNRNLIEFINNPNGTISIELKNIGKIVNK